MTISKSDFIGLPIITRHGNVMVNFVTHERRVVMSRSTYNKLVHTPGHTVTGVVEEAASGGKVSEPPMLVFKSLKF